MFVKYFLLIVSILISITLYAHDLDDSCPQGLYTYKANVIGVYDGDTITVDIDLGFHTWRRSENLRLWGINAPELKGKNKKSGLLSRDWLRDQILNEQVLIQTISTKHGKDKRGKYGRYLVFVYIQKDSGRCININNKLVQKGFAIKHEY